MPEIEKNTQKFQTDNGKNQIFHLKIGISLMLLILLSSS